MRNGDVGARCAGGDWPRFAASLGSVVEAETTELLEGVLGSGRAVFGGVITRLVEEESVSAAGQQYLADCFDTRDPVLAAALCALP